MRYYCDFDHAFKSVKTVETILGPAWCSQIKDNPFFSKDHGLFIPLVADGRVLFYFNCILLSHSIPINEDGLLQLDLAAMQKIEAAGQLKLLPQTVKMLKLVANGKMLAGDSSTRSGYSRNRAGMRVRLPEIMKAILLGYLRLPQEEELLNALNECCYELSSAATITKSRATPFPVRVNAVEDFFSNGKLTTYREKGIGAHLGSLVSRSDKVTKADVEVKWRKPAKSSVWPYTLDHHWFEVQESAVSVANYTLKALLSRSDSNQGGGRQIDRKFPIFNRQTALATSREILESFFVDLTATGSKHFTKWGDVTHNTKRLEGPHSNPVFLIPKLCLMLGVAPTFDKNGTFLKFKPIDNQLLVNTQKVHLTAQSIDTGITDKIDPFITITYALCYSLGLMSLADLELKTGITNGGAALAADPNYIKLTIGPNLVCCISTTFSYDTCAASLARFLSTPIKDLTEEDIEDMGLDTNLIETHLREQTSTC